MAAPLDDAAVVQHQDNIGVLHGGQPMGDDKGGAPSHQGTAYRPISLPTGWVPRNWFEDSIKNGSAFLAKK